MLNVGSCLFTRNYSSQVTTGGKAKLRRIEPLEAGLFLSKRRDLLICELNDLLKLADSHIFQQSRSHTTHSRQ